MSDYFDILGPHQPARQQLDVLPGTPALTPWHYAKWRSLWTPYVIGMLKTLLRPETYKGPDVDIYYSANQANNLLHDFAQASTTPPGCEPPDFDPWVCEANLQTGSGPWVLSYQGPDRWGEHVGSVGWTATTDYDDEVELYVKALKLSWHMDAPFLVYGWGIVYATEVDFAPGGETFRVNDYIGTLGSLLRKESYIVNATTTYNHTIYAVEQGNPQYLDDILLRCYCGADTTPSTLEATSFTLVDFALYGWSGDKPCT